MPEFTAYGSWPSPLSARDLTRGVREFADLCSDGAAAFWLETRPDEAGRTAVMCWRENKLFEISPPDFSARSRVHEYGGGALAAAAGRVWACHAEDQRIYRLENGRAEPLTADEGDVRYGGLTPTPDGRELLAVRESHEDGGEVRNDLVAIDTGDGRVSVIAAGRDFYASPRVSHDGRRLTWLCWDHPHMPWQSAELWLAERENPDAARRLLGGGHVAVADALWLADGRLLYAADPEGWWQPWLWDGEPHPMPGIEGLECGLPLWVLGRRSLAETVDGRRYTLAFGGGEGQLQQIGEGPVAAPRLRHFESLAACGEDLLLIGGGPGLAESLWRLAPDGGLQELRDAGLELPAGLASAPESIVFASGDGHEVQAWFYPPQHPQLRGPEAALPPLIVMAHGGPTAMATPQLRPKTLFWTSRGFAVVDVNYRGSTGFGRAYREALHRQWGAHDVADCLAAAEFLVAEGRVDPGRLLIRGGSAGGLTVLLALCESGDFAAGASYYGVADPAALIGDTHKFESRYMDWLMGPHPECAEVYADRSPLKRLDQLATPLIVFQGLKDKVVPPEQAEALVAALKAKDVEHEYHVFADEAHGFRQGDTIVATLEAELAFYRRVLDIAPAPDE